MRVRVRACEYICIDTYMYAGRYQAVYHVLCLECVNTYVSIHTHIHTYMQATTRQFIMCCVLSVCVCVCMHTYIYTHINAGHYRAVYDVLYLECVCMCAYMCIYMYITIYLLYTYIPTHTRPTHTQWSMEIDEPKAQDSEALCIHVCICIHTYIHTHISTMEHEDR
jgi:hypothetical protein